MINPSTTQIENSAMMGWIHEGFGLFSRGQEIGWFTAHGFIKE